MGENDQDQIDGDCSFDSSQDTYHLRELEDLCPGVAVAIVFLILPFLDFDVSSSKGPRRFGLSSATTNSWFMMMQTLFSCMSCEETGLHTSGPCPRPPPLLAAALCTPSPLSQSAHPPWLSPYVLPSISLPHSPESRMRPTVLSASHYTRSGMNSMSPRPICSGLSPRILSAQYAILCAPQFHSTHLRRF